MTRFLSPTLLLAIPLLCVATSAQAQTHWVGDFETGDISQYNFAFTGNDYITIVDEPVFEGDKAARIELHEDSQSNNGLKRVEVQHMPKESHTAEGATTFFAWSIYLPETLPEDPWQQIGYWESRSSWRQMMAFSLRGTNLSFVTRQPENKVHWTGEGVVTPKTWHRIALQIFWSKDPQQGKVSVWFDGELVVDQVGAKTLNDDNPHFTQFGLFRGDQSFDDVPVIIVDDAIEAASLAEVRPNLPDTPMEPAPDDMGTADMGGSDMATSREDMASDMGSSSQDMPESSDDMGNAGQDQGQNPEPDQGESTPTPKSGDDTEESSCAQASGHSPGSPAAPALLALLLIGALLRRDAGEVQGR